MKYYAIAEINVTNPDWIPEYADKVTKMVEAVGGRYLARTADITVIEGDAAAPNLCAILEFPSKEVAGAFYGSDAYAPFLKSRLDGSNSKFLLVAGKDDTGKATK